MLKSKHSEPQIIAALKQVEAGRTAEDVMGPMLSGGASDGEHIEREEAFLANLQQFECGDPPHATGGGVLGLR